MGKQKFFAIKPYSVFTYIFSLITFNILKPRRAFGVIYFLIFEGIKNDILANFRIICDRRGICHPK